MHAEDIRSSRESTIGSGGSGGGVGVTNVIISGSLHKEGRGMFGSITCVCDV